MSRGRRGGTPPSHSSRGRRRQVCPPRLCWPHPGAPGAAAPRLNSGVSAPCRAEPSRAGLFPACC